MTVIDIGDMTVFWSYEHSDLRGGIFIPDGKRILCIGSDTLSVLSFPGGELLDRLELASFAPVKDYFTEFITGFDQAGTSVYFLGTNSCIYNWKIGDRCIPVLKAKPQKKPSFRTEEYTILSRDGFEVPVKRFIPLKAKQPAILFVHGGPFAPIDPNDPFMLRLLAQGIEICCAAYRGSSGYGKAHQEANRGEYGRGDVWDVIACGEDWKKRTGNKRPLILTGCSYGGFITFLALAGEEIPWDSGIALWTLSGLHRFEPHSQRSLPSDPKERAVALIERSPIEQARRIRVPLLIFHGALDTAATIDELKLIQQRVNAGEGTCELIIFEDDTHSLKRHRDEIFEKCLEFIQTFE
ncbi:prolyl oligopeptidase family serine peptidase [candidate division KSB1 bacterium]|nr:prolyl oligopeptidase family serine peptidase [candidate division KSB1 bacterium]